MTTLGAVLLVLLLAATAAAAAAWSPRGRTVWTPFCGATTAAALAVAGATGAGVGSPAAVAVVTAAAGALAVLGGGPVASTVFALVDRRQVDGESLEEAGAALRGGAWIGCLERAAVVTTLLAGWPEGLAVVAALKGLARFPELRAPAAAERFIIGTFVSVLWAVACAGVVVLAR